MLTYEMDNGATVSDWLGTAMTAAKVCGRMLEEIRADESRLTETALRQAADEAAQALEEITAVMARFDMPHGYENSSFPSTVMGGM